LDGKDEKIEKNDEKDDLFKGVEAHRVLRVGENDCTGFIGLSIFLINRLKFDD